MDHSVTPRMTRHALDRCQEMGIPARLAKAIYRKADVVRPAKRRGKPSRWPRVMCVSDLFPDYAVVIEDRPTGPWVITVVFRTTQEYDRQGQTYAPKGDR